MLLQKFHLESMYLAYLYSIDLNICPLNVSKEITSQSKMLLDLLGKKSMSLHIGIFMNALAIEIKNVP